MSNTEQLVNTGIVGGLAEVKNVARFLTLVETLIERPEGLPGLGVFHGYSGLGKTQASIFAQNMTDAMRIEVGESWSKKTLLQKILVEARVEPRRATIADLTELAINALADNWPRPLFIDEADKLADKKMLELVRELHEHSQVPVLLIGEEQLPEKLETVERVHNRVLDWVAADYCDHDDARLLAEVVCPELTISDDLIDYLIETTKGRARGLVINFNRIKEHACNYREKDLSRGSFDEDFFFTGKRRGRQPRRAA
ncbi:AAA family ATPase [Roseibium sp. SCP14]|uniref:AAA family ATPase n=1 Tax=Roseibium sp. SCP14 TaxID=3141375 RepID=UPI003339A4C9